MAKKYCTFKDCEVTDLDDIKMHRFPKDEERCLKNRLGEIHSLTLKIDSAWRHVIFTYDVVHRQGANHVKDAHGEHPPAVSSKCKKVFVQRDYSEGTNVKFQTKFPPELEGLIDRQSFELTINTLNRMYAEAENVSCGSAMEGCLACLTAYVLYLCMETHYQRSLKRIASFLDEQNETVWIPVGLHIMDPIERGLRVIEIAILTEPA